MAGDAPVHALVYNSDAIREFRDDELNDLLSHARRRNAERGISGMLVYAGGNFMQYIEGTGAAIEGLFERIAVDPRHRNVRRLAADQLPERLFPDWSMAFRRIRTGRASTEPAEVDADAALETVLGLDATAASATLLRTCVRLMLEGEPLAGLERYMASVR